MNKTRITRPPGYELFFSPLEVHLDPTEIEMIRFAYIASKFGHHDQRRDDGSRYFDHPKTVAWIYIDELGGRDTRTIAVILLHDILEDTYLLSPYRTSLNFGEDIALDVRALTKLPKGKETTEEYLGRVCSRGGHTILAKLLDRLHNLRDISYCDKEKQEKQVIETETYHLPILIAALQKCESPWKDFADTVKAKLQDAIREIRRSWDET